MKPNRATTSALAGLTSLVLAAGVAAAVPTAGAAEPACTTGSVESDPAFGSPDVDVRRTAVRTTVVHRTPRLVAIRRGKAGAWRAAVRLRAVVDGRARHAVDARVTATVTATATATCDGTTATATASGSGTGTGTASVHRTVRHRDTVRAAARAKARRAAQGRAERRALERVRRQARREVRAADRRRLAERRALAEYRARVQAQRVAAERAAAAARADAEDRARRGRPTPTPTPTVTTPTPTTTETSSPSPTPTKTSTPAPSATSSSPAPTASSTPTTQPTPPAPGDDDPHLIKHGWDLPVPAYVKRNVATMEQMPFDGLTVQMSGGLSSKVQSQTRVTYEQLRDALAPMRTTTFTTLRHNFVMAYSAPAGDLFGDWTVPLQNYADLARAAEEAGLEGVFYDIEEYFGAALRYPASCSGRTVEACQAQARLRGRQVMDAMRSQWPGITVLSTFGPWMSAAETAKNLPGVVYNDIAWANPLSGPFLIGMIESTVGTPARFVDGGEIYTARTPAHFSTVRSWQKTGMPQKSALVPSTLRDVWASNVSASFGIYDRPWIGVGMDASTWTTTIANALGAADDYVWLYTEQHDWWGSGWPTTPVPKAWVDATREARRLAGT